MFIHEGATRVGSHLNRLSLPAAVPIVECTRERSRPDEQIGLFLLNIHTKVETSHAGRGPLSRPASWLGLSGRSAM